MKPLRVLLATAAVLCTGLALAHTGVDGATKVRMDLMSGIGDATKALGKIAKSGEFDPAETEPLARQIADRAARIGTVFEEPHMHPKTEALPAVWQEWERFNELGRDLAVKANALAAATEPDAFTSALKDMAAACKACHRDFKKE